MERVHGFRVATMLWHFMNRVPDEKIHMDYLACHSEFSTHLN
jgi:hypothetical protein